MNNPWFRLYSEIVDDEKLRLLAFEDRWHYVAILCCKCKGILDGDDSREMMFRKVAVKTGLQGRELEEVARRLDEVGLINRDTLQPMGWDVRQFVSDSSTPRVQRHREKRKENKEDNECNHGNRCSNGDETLQERFCNGPDTDTDTDTELEEAKASSPHPAVPVAGEVIDLFGNPKSSRVPPCPHNDIIDLYHQVLPETRPVVVSRWRNSRGARDLSTRWREDKRHQNLNFWKNLFETVRTNKFWLDGTASWKFSLAWMLKREKFDEVLARMVDNARRGGAHG